MLNYRLGFTPEKLFARSSQKKGLLHILQTTLVAVLSLPNVIKGIIVLFVCGVGGAYLMMLWWEATHQLLRELKEGGERGPKRVERMYAMKGHTQVSTFLSNCLVTLFFVSFTFYFILRISAISV